VVPILPGCKYRVPRTLLLPVDKTSGFDGVHCTNRRRLLRGGGGRWEEKSRSQLLADPGR